jgi:hypothetical protein
MNSCVASHAFGSREQIPCLLKVAPSVPICVIIPIPGNVGHQMPLEAGVNLLAQVGFTRLQPSAIVWRSLWSPRDKICQGF